MEESREIILENCRVEKVGNKKTIKCEVREKKEIQDANPI